MLSPILAAVTLAAAPGPLDWVEDDWAKAQARAKAEKKLVAVDVWATWCHTCLSMKNFVLTEAPLAKVKDRHVYLALNYDRPENAEFFKKFPINAFPTFLVVDPAGEKVVARWVGSGTSEQMVHFLKGASIDTKDPLALAQQAMARQDYAKAKAHLEVALARAESQAQRTRALNTMGEALWKTGKEACARFGAEHAGEVDHTAPGVDFVALAAYCATAIKDKKARLEILEPLGAMLARVAEAGSFGSGALSIDDQSAVLATLADIREDQGQKKAATNLNQRRLELLEAAVEKAPSAEASSTFNAYLVDAYLRFDRFKDAERLLTASEKAIPADFNHPWRLAKVHLAARQHDRALVAINRALERGYGPRRVRLYATKADILIAKKQYRDAQKTIDQARAEVSKIDKKLVRQSWLDGLTAREDKIKKSEVTN